jgi:hypothetical protein
LDNNDGDPIKAISPTKHERPDSLAADHRLVRRVRLEMKMGDDGEQKSPAMALAAIVAQPRNCPVPSLKTFLKCLQEYAGFTKFLRKHKLSLTPEMRAARVEWCKQHKHVDWSKWIISDEKYWERGKVLRRLLGRHYWGTVEDAEVAGAHHPKQSGTMKWAAIGFPLGPTMRTKLATQQTYPENHPMKKKVLKGANGDEAVQYERTKGINTGDYIQCLKDHLFPLLRKHNVDQHNYPLRDTVFQQDNAGIHGNSNSDHDTPALKRVKEALKPLRLVLAWWPPHSPDLSPIEHLWDLVQRRVVFDPNAPPAKFIADVERAWDEFPVDIIKKLLLSMPYRIKACLAWLPKAAPSTTVSSCQRRVCESRPGQTSTTFAPSALR